MENENLTALQMVMRDIEEHYPKMFDVYTQEGREFIQRFHKYLDIEKKQMNIDFLHQLFIFAWDFICDESIALRKEYSEEEQNEIFINFINKNYKS
jgi:hypothetical protein